MSFIDLVAHVNKQMPNSLPDLRDRAMVEHPHISTGSFIVDWVTAIGGLPRGKVTELHGLQSSGKTTALLMTAAECQGGGEGVLYIDFEHAVDPKYAETLGVQLDPSLWAIYQPASMEDGLRVADYFMSKPGCGLIVCDSVAAMTPQAEASAEIGDTQIGLQARQLSVALRQIKHKIAVWGGAFVFINQLRDIVDLTWVGQQAARRSPQYTTPGGRALKFYADLRLEFIPTGQEKVERDSLFGARDKEKVVIGQRAKVTAVKNKCAAPFRSGEIYIRHGKGIDSTVPCVDLAIKYKLLSEAGGYFKISAPYCDPSALEQTVHGRENLITYFESCPEQLNLLFSAVWDNLKVGGM